MKHKDNAHYLYVSKSKNYISSDYFPKLLDTNVFYPLDNICYNIIGDKNAGKHI